MFTEVCLSASKSVAEEKKRSNMVAAVEDFVVENVSCFETGV